jgi:hypothetical protein
MGSLPNRIMVEIEAILLIGAKRGEKPFDVGPD